MVTTSSLSAAFNMGFFRLLKIVATDGQELFDK